MPLRIVLDAMGTDRAPADDVLGAVQAIKQTSDTFSVVLVGDEKRIEAELAKFPDADRSRLEIRHAPTVIAMGEEPAQAVRSKRDSSLVVGVTMQKEDEADAFVSAGNTGAVMAASTFILGRAPGVNRPTIASQFPAEEGFTIVADVGANVDTKPRNLLEFAVMTEIYAREIFGIENPTVGLLNVGEEEGKGETRVAEAFGLLRESSLNFVGNVEGRDILKGSVDVVVCDGFVGNVLLKFAESVTGLLKAKLMEYAGRSIGNKIMAGLARSTLRGVFREMNYEEYGGVPLLGVNGVSIIGHGGSSPKAIRNMILKAEEMVRKEVDSKISRAMSGLHETESRS
jgi:glycerol-3-phosphate acyltransferase PlsX